MYKAKHIYIGAAAGMLLAVDAAPVILYIVQIAEAGVLVGDHTHLTLVQMDHSLLGAPTLSHTITPAIHSNRNRAVTQKVL